jgi:hypothetical protein
MTVALSLIPTLQFSAACTKSSPSAVSSRISSASVLTSTAMLPLFSLASLDLTELYTDAVLIARPTAISLQLSNVLNWIVSGDSHIQSQIDLTTDGHLASLSWYQATITDPRPIFFLISIKIFADGYGFLLVGRPLWREGWSVIYPYNY